ncbi:MAG: glycosyltransferase, partial [Haloferacaceae archaeon]
MKRVAGLVAGLLSLTGLPYLIYLALYALERPTGSPAAKLPQEPTVSIVLPTYNEAAIVEAKLEDLLGLEYPMEKVQVVVIDSSDDGTADLVERFFAGRDAPDPLCDPTDPGDQRPEERDRHHVVADLERLGDDLPVGHRWFATVLVGERVGVALGDVPVLPD